MHRFPGQNLQLHIAVAPLLSRDFVPVGRIILVDDITERVSLEAQLTQSDKLSSIGLLAAAVVALQIAQTIAEEEVIRAAHVSGPTRVRRFLSRFLVVLIVALAFEGLVATFRALHENPAQLPAAASIVIGTGVLLASWGLFIRFNRGAEELEPEAMEEAKREDTKLKL